MSAPLRYCRASRAGGRGRRIHELVRSDWRCAEYRLSAILALVQAGAPAAQTCKYDSIPATAPASRFSDNRDGTVTDTGLQWKRCSKGQT